MGEDENISADVDALLEILREQTKRQIIEDVHIQSLDLEQRIRERASELLSTVRREPAVPDVIDLLRGQVGELTDLVQLQDVGTVQRIGSGVARLSGLHGASTDELVSFPTGVQGLILNLDHARLDVVLLGPDEGIQGGDVVTATGGRVRVPVGHQLLGRVVNPLGEPLDESGPLQATDRHFLDREAPDIIERAPVNEPLHTGWKIVDALFPIGRGQRELILGDRQTGKTTLAVDAILNQRGSEVSCVYVSIGQKKSSSLNVVETLRRH
ncbi:MAG: hypothetical protein U9Q78_06480, partial [Chloroflexota bacterium]|nr:hypothetical protein [Chloroflexota bacterium]